MKIYIIFFFFHSFHVSVQQKSISFLPFVKKYISNSIDIAETKSYQEMLIVENSPLIFQDLSDFIKLNNITLDSNNSVGSFSFWVKPISQNNMNIISAAINIFSFTSTTAMIALGGQSPPFSVVVPVYTISSWSFKSPTILDWTSANNEF